MIKRIAITGPESTGKTWLTEKLAAYYKTGMVEEFSREYFHDKKYEYILDDLIAIAENQLSNENKIASLSKDIIFCDTDLLSIKVWAKVVFDKVPQWIENQLKNHKYDLYLLCFPDLMWQPDPLRSNPHNRQYIYSLFVDELEQNDFNYKVVKGIDDQRLKNAINFVDELLANDNKGR